MSKSAVIWNVGEKWKVEEVELAAPGPGQVRIKVMASGLCHSDDHYVTGDMPGELPLVGGHEGAGIIEAVGEGVTRVKPGDHVVMVFNPPCGDCEMCARGQGNICFMSPKNAAGGATPSPFNADGKSVGAVGDLGTFGEYTVVSEKRVVKIDDDIPFASAALLGCAVITGWGAAVRIAKVQPGDNVVVIGAGGIGLNSLQGADNAGADLVIAVDPVEFKQQKALEFGATHAVSSIEQAQELLLAETGRLADVAIISVGVGTGTMLQEADGLVRPGGKTVITAVTPLTSNTLDFNIAMFTLSQKTLIGNVYGGVNVYHDIPLILGLYKRGKIKLDELITQTYSLEDINQGYADMHAGKNLRGVVVHDH